MESHSSTLDNNQLMDLDSISNQYNTNSVLPLRLPNDNRGNPAPNSHHLTGTISQINLMRARPSSSSDNTQPPFATNHDFSYPMMLQRDTHSSCLAEYQIGTHRVVGFTVGKSTRKKGLRHFLFRRGASFMSSTIKSVGHAWVQRVR